MTLESKKSKRKTNTVDSQGKQKVGHGSTMNNEKDGKFETYYDFSIPIKYAKPHQVLAINRGENQKMLSVKINIPEHVKHHLRNVVERRFISNNSPGYVRQMIRNSFEDSFIRLLQPMMVRHFRYVLITVDHRLNGERYLR